MSPNPRGRSSHNFKIAQRASAIGSANIAVTTITLEEQLRGRLAAIRRATAQSENLAVAHTNLQKTLLFFCQVNLLVFNGAACAQYQRLLQAKLRVGTHDLQIAAIALAHQAILVTRNHQDFARVPHLVLEDWSL